MKLQEAARVSNMSRRLLAAIFCYESMIKSIDAHVGDPPLHCFALDI